MKRIERRRQCEYSPLKGKLGAVRAQSQLAQKAFAAFVRRMKRTREEVASTIDGFINGTGRQWDWDGFTSIRIDESELEAIRQRCVAIPTEFPPTTRGAYCSDAGLQVMRDLLQGLRAHPAGRT